MISQFIIEVIESVNLEGADSLGIQLFLFVPDLCPSALERNLKLATAFPFGLDISNSFIV